MVVQVVLVHGIRTSATMWRSQVEYLAERGNPVTPVDLPGHGSRMSEEFTLEGALATIDDAVRDAAARGPVLLAGHSMGGLISIEYVGQEDTPPVAGFIAASCTAIPRGVGLATYRMLARGFDGTFHTTTAFRTAAADIITFAAVVVAAAALVAWDRLVLS